MCKTAQRGKGSHDIQWDNLCVIYSFFFLLTYRKFLDSSFGWIGIQEDMTSVIEDIMIVLGRIHIGRQKIIDQKEIIEMGV